MPCISMLNCHSSHLAIVLSLLAAVDSNVSGSVSSINLNSGVCFVCLISKLPKMMSCRLIFFLRRYIGLFSRLGCTALWMAMSVSPPLWSRANQYNGQLTLSANIRDTYQCIVSDMHLYEKNLFLQNIKQKKKC